MKFVVSILGLCMIILANGQEYDQMNWENLRKEMVREQIFDRGISDPDVLRAMSEVPRHRFVPANYRKSSYDDNPLPIGYDQTISQPYIVAYMTEILELGKSDKVLEIGAGSGYQAAILAEIVDSVYTIEIVRPLGERAKEVLHELDYTNVRIKIGDGYKGWPAHAPFDAIIVTCAPNDIPQPLQDQLSEGGRMIIPAGDNLTQFLYVLEKKNGKVKRKKVLPVRFVPMIDEEGDKY